jgi:hypothetical protein
MANTVADVLAECRRLGIALESTDSGVKCTAPKGAMTAALAASVKAHRDEIRQLLTAESKHECEHDAAHGSSRGDERTRELATWPAHIGALADLVLLLTAEDLPAAPFTLRQESVVVDAEKFLHAIQADIRAGPYGPRSGSLQRDLCRLSAAVLGSPS